MNMAMFIKQAPKILALLALLAGTILLDALSYGFTHTCPSCTTFSQFLFMPAAASAPILASIQSLISLTKQQK